ncbi:MAG: cysteine desulfurase [Nitrospinae bacterium]|nr:cysteine desulfurase [Nitrospinota bacterium]
MKRIYLDYNASAPLMPEALEAALPYYTDVWGNPSSIHRLGREARIAVEDAREHVAQLLGASNPLDMVFTSSGTEAINLAIQGRARGHGGRGRHVITTAVEHPAVLDTCRILEQQGFVLTYVRVDGQGCVDPDALADAICPETVLVSVIHGNHEVGTLQPLADLAAVAHAHGVPLHVDAAQAVGRVEIDVQACGIDLLSFSGHKVGAPTGVGALYVREGLGASMQAVLHGGHQERERRAGTEDVPSIVALGRACAVLRQRVREEGKRLAALRDHLETALLERIPRLRMLGKDAERLPNTSNISFPGVKGEALVFNLDLLGIAVSTGASCSSRQGAPSQVLEAMGVSPEEREGSVRWSLGYATTVEDIERVIELLPPTVERLRRLSPFY